MERLAETVSGTVRVEMQAYAKTAREAIAVADVTVTATPAPYPGWSPRQIAAMHIHDARCDGDPCYDANTEQHRQPPTEDDFQRADRLLAALGMTRLHALAELVANPETAARRLAAARQQIAVDNPWNAGFYPPFGQLTEDEQETSTLEARNYLRALASLLSEGA
jgi:hypothetical protein